MRMAEHDSSAVSIGTLARRTGCKVQTIRYYEQIGLMPPAARTGGNQRFYSGRHAARLAFIRHARELGFPLDAVRTLLDISDNPERSCEAADEIARSQLREVDSRIERLEALRAELQRMLRQCRRNKVADCRVIEALADHSHAHCLTPDHGDPSPPAAGRRVRTTRNGAGRRPKAR